MAQSGGDDMAQAIWKKTLKEVAAGTMAGPFTLEQMLQRHGKYLNLVPSFGLKQGDKYRRIDDHSASHNNLAAERTQQIQMAMVDYLMTMVSSMGKSFRGSLVIGTEDMAGAYRQVPLTDSQVSISVTAVYNPELEQTQLFEIYGQPFGAAHAVPNFYRVAEWACRLMVRAYRVMIDHFFDDYFAVLRDLEAESTMFCIREAFRLIGLVLDPEKSQPPSDFAMVLGVAFNTKSLQEQKLLLVEPKPTRVSNLCALVDRIIQEGSLAPSLAASLLGKFGFLCSTLFGKVGRCCTGAIRARQYGHPDETALTPSILTSLHLIKLFAKTAPRREMSFGEADPPLILYTDASDVPGRICRHYQGLGELIPWEVLERSCVNERYIDRCSETTSFQCVPLIHWVLTPQRTKMHETGRVSRDGKTGASSSCELLRGGETRIESDGCGSSHVPVILACYHLSIHIFCQCTPFGANQPVMESDLWSLGEDGLGPREVSVPRISLRRSRFVTFRHVVSVA
eukprot:s134_g14.t1